MNTSAGSIVCLSLQLSSKQQQKPAFASALYWNMQALSDLQTDRVFWVYTKQPVNKQT